MTTPYPDPFPGTLYDGDGTRLAGTGPEVLPELDDTIPHKALLRDRPGGEEVVVMEHGDRLWLLPDSFGSPPELPISLLAELATVVRAGRKLGLAGRDHTTYVLARDALMLLLNDTGGQA